MMPDVVFLKVDVVSVHVCMFARGIGHCSLTRVLLATAALFLNVG